MELGTQHLLSKHLQNGGLKKEGLRCCWFPGKIGSSFNTVCVKRLTPPPEQEVSACPCTLTADFCRKQSWGVATSLSSSRTPGLTPVTLILVTYSQRPCSSSSIRNSLWLCLSPSQPLFPRSALLCGYVVRQKPRQEAASKGQRPAACAMPPKLFAQRIRMHSFVIHSFIPRYPAFSTVWEMESHKGRITFHCVRRKQ